MPSCIGCVEGTREGDMMEIKQAIARSHAAWEAFVLGDPEPSKEIFSHGEDAIIANPWGATERGWNEVSKALDEAAPGRFEARDRARGRLRDTGSRFHVRDRAVA